MSDDIEGLKGGIKHLAVLGMAAALLASCFGPESYRRVEGDTALARASGQCRAEALRSSPSQTPNAGAVIGALARQAAAYDACMQGKGYTK